ncbi:abc transporter [Moniliophthora roreri]|nr:abc transporter [Moniliophthora roreri]
MNESAIPTFAQLRCGLPEAGVSIVVNDKRVSRSSSHASCSIINSTSTLLAWRVAENNSFIDFAPPSKARGKLVQGVRLSETAAFLGAAKQHCPWIMQKTCHVPRLCLDAFPTFEAVMIRKYFDFKLRRYDRGSSKAI